MNFVAQVEDHLRDLGAEARKSHPGKKESLYSRCLSSILLIRYHSILSIGVKEASERAILHLRSLQTQYVAAVRRAGASKSPTSQSKSKSDNNSSSTTSQQQQQQHPTTALFRSHDVLRPFLLALNHPDASPALISSAMEAIQLLLRGDAVISADGVYIATALYGQARECNKTSNNNGTMITGAMASVGVGALGLFRGTTTSSSSAAAAYASSDTTHRVLTLNQRAAKEDQSIAYRVLQTITMLVDSRSIQLTCEVLSQCLLGCLVLGAAHAEYEEKEQGGGSSNNGVGRAALATMNQIMNLAFRTLMDLCTIVGDSYDQTAKTRTLTGPFAATVKEKLAPLPRTCLSLIDMIFKQRGIDFFRVCQQHFKNDNDGCKESDKSSDSDSNLQFAIQSIHQTSQLVISILQRQHIMYYSSKKSYESLNNPSLAFCFYYYATSLATTILTNYLTPYSMQFYQRFDAINLGDNTDTETTPIMSQSALTMIQLLVNFVSGATEAYHKSEFEDGYIFNQTERESLNIGIDSNADESPDDGTNHKTMQIGATQATPDSLVSNDQLWRAGDEPVPALTISTITKAASDLATISGSNRERILHVVLIAHGDASVIGEPSSAATSLAEKFSDSQSARSGDVPICDTGLATWLSYKCILALAQSLKRVVVSSKESETSASSQQVNARQILKEVFAPSVSILQHYIKRMSGSHVVVSLTLSAYNDLAYTSMMLDSKGDNLRRHTILTSLCKLCLPSWGKNRANSQLKESNIDSLRVLLRIIHEQYDNIHDEWHTILSTLDQLAILSIKSSKLPNSYYNKASDIAESLARLPQFTTCFSSDALSNFVNSLVSLSKLVSLTQIVEQTGDLSRQNSESFDYGDGKDDIRRESVSGKLISFAGRSLGFGGSLTQAATTNTTLRRAYSVDSAGQQFSRVYSEELREAATLTVAAMKISTPRSTIRKLPLPLLLLCVAAEANSYRFKVVEEPFALHLCDIVANSTVPEYRTFAMEILIHFIPLSLSGSSEISSIHHNQPISEPSKQLNNKPLDIIAIQKDCESVEESSSCSKDTNLLKILCDTMHHTEHPETAETGLNALHVILEGAIHNVSGDNLVGVIETLSRLSGLTKSDNDQHNDTDRSSKSWANVSSKAFQIFKIIFDEFLEPSVHESPEQPCDTAKEQEAIVDCCVSFGKSRHDVNTSLTATGMLWTLADQDPTPATLDLVLAKLSYLALDDRPELRNCAVNTLISCAVGRGHQFTHVMWKRVLNQTIFGIMNSISEAINDSSEKAASGDNGGAQRYKVAVHHSRDSIQKQWSTTLVLTLRGLERVLRLFYPQLLTSMSSSDKSNDPWFFFTWTEILRFSLESATLSGGRETLDIRLAGIELMTLCAQLSCMSGMIASANAARVGTNMEVVGGALRSVRAATVVDEHTKTEDTPLEPKLEEWRRRLFDLAFASLVADFREHLECSQDADETSNHYMIDSVSTQVLIKLTGELDKLYECCKNDEMKPGSVELRLDILSVDDGSYESRFINLLIALADKCPSEGSRFLNQVQRGVMTLLQSIASHSSLRAFKALTSLSGDRIFVRSTALSADVINNESDDKEGDVVVFQ
eukprot:scaffold4387_cov32-Cyclotella_meneghiniana.AAC.5